MEGVRDVAKRLAWGRFSDEHADRPVLAVAVRAARRAAAVITDASRDLKRLPTYSKEHGEIVSTAEPARPSRRSSRRSARRFPIMPSQARRRGTAPANERVAVSMDHRSARRHDELRPQLPLLRSVDRACSRRDALTHAVVLDPVHDELFTAISGRGAHLNSAPIRTSACTRMQDALIGTVVPTRKSPRLHALSPRLQRARREVHVASRRGRFAGPRVRCRGQARRILRDEPRDLGRGRRRIAGCRGRRTRRRFRRLARSSCAATKSSRRRRAFSIRCARRSPPSRRSAWRRLATGGRRGMPADGRRRLGSARPSR